MLRDGCRLEVAADAALAAERAAARVAEALRGAVATRGVASIAVSGGATPHRMLECLAAERLPWGKVHVFQVDERIVARDAPERNLHGLVAAFAKNRAALGRIRGMPVEARDPRRGAAEYAEGLRDVLGAEMRLDVVHLGLGADGHTASLVPGDAALDADEIVAVTGPYQGTRRMTLTFGMLDRAHLRLWLVTGESKRVVLGRLVNGDPELVASRVKREDSIIVADAAAAGQH